MSTSKLAIQSFADLKNFRKRVEKHESLLLKGKKEMYFLVNFKGTSMSLVLPIDFFTQLLTLFVAEMLLVQLSQR